MRDVEAVSGSRLAVSRNRIATLIDSTLEPHLSVKFSHPFRTNR
jgi:hypothetical protein